MNPPFIAAVIIMSPNPRKLVKFYREVLGIPFDPSDHGGSTELHYDCQLGDVHMAIYPVSDASTGQQPHVGEATTSRAHFALAVGSLDELTSHLKSFNLSPLYEPAQLSFARKTAIHDPDGNLIELVELSRMWAEHLRSRPQHERDVTHLVKFD